MLFLCALIIGDERNARGRHGLDAVSCHANRAVVECGAQMMHCAAR